MTVVYKGCSLPAEYNYVLGSLCGIYSECTELTDELATAVVERLTAFLETGEINRNPVVEGPRDPFMEFWKVYGGDIDGDDIILEEDVEFCIEWLSKNEGSTTADSKEQQG